MYKVSVIIPVYNVEKYLKECLNSVINQTLKDIEIICVNDGSKDNSLKILEEYALKDNRIKIITQENGGLSSARNTGIINATGEYIGFVDSDDWISLDYFQLLYENAKEHEADIAYCSLSTVKNGVTHCCYNVSKKEIAHKTSEKYELANIPYNCHVVNKIYRRDKVVATGVLFELKIYYEDMEWTHKILHYLGKMVTVPSCQYYYRDRDDSIVNMKSEINKQSLSAARYKSLAFIQNNFIKIKNLKPYFTTRKITIKFFNISIIKIKYYGRRKVVCFLGLPIIQIDDFRRALYFSGGKNE